jgi:hypothetical protein
MLTTGAIVLLGLTVMTVNRTFSTHGSILTQTQIGLYGISLAASRIQDAASQSFDEATKDSGITSTTYLTAAGSLGKETGDVTTNLDDFDDYNNLVTGEKIMGVDTFVVRSYVHYVSDAAPDIDLASKSWHKRIDVRVTSFGNTDTIKLSYVFSYFTLR